MLENHKHCIFIGVYPEGIGNKENGKKKKKETKREEEKERHKDKNYQPETGVPFIPEI